jgi:hypothetical protein
MQGSNPMFYSFFLTQTYMQQTIDVPNVLGCVIQDGYKNKYNGNKYKNQQT